MAFRDLIAGMDAALVGSLGEPTTYTPATTGVPKAVTGIFDAAYVRVDVGRAGVGSAGPALFYRESDLPADAAAPGAEIVVRGVTYRVDEVQKDGQGGVRLLLKRRS